MWGSQNCIPPIIWKFLLLLLSFVSRWENEGTQRGKSKINLNLTHRMAGSWFFHPVGIPKARGMRYVTEQDAEGRN